MQPAHLVEGSVFADEFRVLRLIGQGAMGSVYAVEQWRTGHQRALKIMQPGLVHDQGMRARFLQEAQVESRIRSDHVVHVVGAGIEAEQGIPWIAMELLDGQSLAALLQQRGALPLDDVREIFAQLCHAVDAAHEAGVVHRDLKPGNIFLAASRRDGVPFTVKVLDFGIAKLVAEAAPGARLHRRPTAPIGTPSWMAPEQAVPAAEVTTATDVWPLGLILYALLVGQPFWRGPIEPIPAASARAARHGAAHLLPSGFDAWFARCVHPNPAARYQRAREARAGFEAILPTAEPRPGVTPSLRVDGAVPAVVPLRPDEATVRMTPPRRSTPAERPKRVLLVDDGPVDQRIVGHMLRSAGYTVLVASSGEEGLAVAARELPSLIVLDFMLPDIDAPEVLRRLRGSPATAEVPVILLTSTDFVGHIAQGFQAGANDYLMKPVDGRLLGERIEAALSARHPAR